MQDSDEIRVASDVDDWIACFSQVTSSRPGTFPFTSHNIHSIESRRARMSDLLIFDVLLIRGGIRNPDMLFPPADWASLRKLLDAIDASVYDTLKKDCLVYILLKWAWDTDSRETNPGWDARYIQDRCIPPQFVALADAYWLLDTGNNLSKAVSILSDARLNRDYVSKVLQALALSSPPASFASDVPAPTAPLIVKYVRTAKPLLTEPDDIDLYTLSLAQLSFMDAWTYQRSFPEGDTRERLLGKIVGWCLMPTPKQEPLAQLLAFPLSPYEESFLHTFALPSQFSTCSLSPNVNAHVTSSPSGPLLSPHAIFILQDLLCVRAIQSGDYVRAIKLDRQFSSVSPSLNDGIPSSGISQATLSGRDSVDRKSIIQDLFAALPPAERTLLEDEIGKVATGVRTYTSSTHTPQQGTSTPVRRPLTAEFNLSASWEDVSVRKGSHVPSTLVSHLPSAAGAGFTSKATPVSTTNHATLTSTPASPFVSRVPASPFGRQAPPAPKFTAFGSPIPSTTGVISERAKTLFSSSAVGGPGTVAKPATRTSLFDTVGSAKNAPNAFYNPSSAPGTTTLDVSSALASSGTVKDTEQVASTATQNGKAHSGESDGEDVSMRSGSDGEVIEKGRDESRGEELEEEAPTDEEDTAENFVRDDKRDAIADLTLHMRHTDGLMDEDHKAGPVLGFSVFGGRRNVTKKGTNGDEQASYVSPPRRARVPSSRKADMSLSASTGSATTGKYRAPPGAFHAEEEEEEERFEENGSQEDTEEEGEDDHASLTTPIQSPRRSTRTRSQSETPSASSQPQRNAKNTLTAADNTSKRSKRSRRTSSRPNLTHSIPGALMDEDIDERGQDNADHTDAHGDEDTEMDEQEEEDDLIAPLPSRSSRRTRSSGHVGVSTKSKSNAKPTASVKMTATTTSAKGKPKARVSEVKTPARRSSRLSMASSTSPDQADLVSPTKGRKSTGSRASIAGSASGAVATRSSARRKR